MKRKQEVFRGLSPGRSGGRSSSPSGSGLLRQRRASHAPPLMSTFRDRGALMEGPDPNASECGGDTPIFLLITKGLDDDREDLSGDEDGESRDVREIRSSIGLICTKRLITRKKKMNIYDRLAEGKGKARNCFHKETMYFLMLLQLRTPRNKIVTPCLMKTNLRFLIILSILQNTPFNSLDSCGELDDESNSQACRYVLEEVKKWKNNLQTEEPSSTLLKSVSFVPKKKTNNAIVTKCRVC